MLFNLSHFLKAELIEVNLNIHILPITSSVNKTASPKEACDSWGMKKMSDISPMEYHKPGSAWQPDSHKGNSHTCVHSTDFGQIPGRCKPIWNRLQDQDIVYMENLSLWNNSICSCQLNLIWENMSCQQMQAMCLWKAGVAHFQQCSTLFNVSANVSSILPSKCCGTTCFMGTNDSHSKN